MTHPSWVLDTGALMAYAHGVELVGQTLVDVADAEGIVAIPLVCVIEAYSLLDPLEYEHLRLLRRNPCVRTAAPAFDVDRIDECPMIGGIARRIGRLGAGHAVYTALVSAASIMTSRSDQLRSVLGDDWAIVEV